MTTLAYEWAPDPLKLTRVTDPFGRTAVLSHTGDGLLASITDMLGMTSSFTYENGDFIAGLTTPYGTTTFRKESNPDDSQTNPVIEAIDPLGGVEHLEYRWENSGVPATEPAGWVPEGFAAANTDLDKYNTLYWDKQAWAAGPYDVTKATVTHWLWYQYPDSGTTRATTVAHSIKRPLESRVWYAYPGQSDPRYVGTHTTPSVTARVLDDGTTQKTLATYNAQGQVLMRTDALGRQTSYTYAANGIDLLEVRQTSPGVNDLLASYGDYNAQHLPGTVRTRPDRRPRIRTTWRRACGR